MDVSWRFRMTKRRAKHVGRKAMKAWRDREHFWILKRNESAQGFLRRKMLTSLWRSGFLSYVLDVGLWSPLRKYGSTWHKQNLDKIIATGVLQGKENNIAPRRAISFNSTSANKSWWIDCTDTSLMDSEISDNSSLIIQTLTSIATKQWTEILHISGPDPAWNNYLQQ